MGRKIGIFALPLVLILLGAALVFYLQDDRAEASKFLLAKAVRRELRITVSTNGIIEPLDRCEIYAPIDGVVVELHKKEGERIEQGELLLRLESESTRSALAEARANLLQQKRQARLVIEGPPAEEINALEASIAECEMQLEQQNRDLLVEESLYSRGATTRAAMEALRHQRDLLQFRADALKKKKQDLLQRYAPEEKAWERQKLEELTKQVEMLERQLKMESVLAPARGLIYSLPVKAGSYVVKGQLLAQLYEPGRVMLRAYVDEPDLGRIAEGQAVVIEWDGMPDRTWTGVVDRPARQVVPLSNRSVGNVFCTIFGAPKELIPNLNVRVEIITARKENALVVPRAAVFSRGGQPMVMLWENHAAVMRPVKLGLVTPEEIEIVDGIAAGSSVVLNHGEAGSQ